MHGPNPSQYVCENSLGIRYSDTAPRTRAAPATASSMQTHPAPGKERKLRLSSTPPGWSSLYTRSFVSVPGKAGLVRSGRIRPTDSGLCPGASLIEPKSRGQVTGGKGYASPIAPTKRGALRQCGLRRDRTRNRKSTVERTGTFPPTIREKSTTVNNAGLGTSISDLPARIDARAGSLQRDSNPPGRDTPLS